MYEPTSKYLWPSFWNGKKLFWNGRKKKTCLEDRKIPERNASVLKCQHKKKKAARYLFPYLCCPSTKNHAWGKRGTSKIFAEWVKSWGSILWGSLSSWALPTVYWDHLATEEARAPPGQSLPGSDIQWGDIRHSPLHSRQVFGKRADVTSLGSTSIFVLLNRAIKEEAIWQNN